MPDTSHTPTPWRVDPDEGRILAEDPRQTIVIPSFGGSFSNPEIAADAAFIVRAVNAHDDLVAALKQCRNELVSIHHGDWKMEHAERFSAGLRMANAALAAMEG